MQWGSDMTDQNSSEETKAPIKCFFELPSKVTDVILDGWKAHVPAAVNDPTALRSLLQETSRAVFLDLGVTFKEKAYQNALIFLLKDLGFQVADECEIGIFYRGQKLTTRRSDIQLRHDSSKEFFAILELKIVTGKNSDESEQWKRNLPQLHYYMKKQTCKLGFLIIFFPILDSFPPIEQDEPFLGENRKDPFVSEPYELKR